MSEVVCIEANIYHDIFKIHKSLMVEFLEELYTSSTHTYTYMCLYT